MIEAEKLHRDGYALLRGAIPPEWLDGLRATFDSCVKPSDQWAVPRGHDWRHSWLDLDPRVQAVCRLENVLAVAGALIGERFFLSQVEGREPLAGGGYQVLHRDLSAERPGDTVSAIAYFDDYGPENGATRIVPGSHRAAPDAPPFDFNDESEAVQLQGSAGDILVLDADLVHAASRNPTGARRRSILITYLPSRATPHISTRRISAVSEWIRPTGSIRRRKQRHPSSAQRPWPMTCRFSGWREAGLRSASAIPGNGSGSPSSK